MRLLLDTHAVLWWLMDDPRLPPSARTVIGDRDNELFVSACAAYEIVYKQGRGRLPPLPESLPRQFQREGITALPISLDHALAGAALPGPHRDPWDRIMMAQAMVEGLTVVTVDRRFAECGVATLW